jgi:hypothetical protein
MLALLAAGAWTRTHWAFDQLSWQVLEPRSNTWTRCALDMAGGEVGLNLDADLGEPYARAAPSLGVVPSGARVQVCNVRHNASQPARGFVMGHPTFWSDIGFGWHPDGPYFVDRTSGWRHFQLVVWVPFWPFMLLMMLVAASWGWSLRRRYVAASRRRNLLCQACGYDLRASSGLCPECGAACKAAYPAGVSPAAGD